MSRRICLVTFLFFLTASETSVSLAAPSDAQVCKETHYKFQVRKGVIADIGFFEPLVPEGAVVMNLGPERHFKDLKMFIQTFCNHGFSVAAYNLISTDRGTHGARFRRNRLMDSDFLKTARKVTEKLQSARSTLSLISYGWSKGSKIAATLMTKSRHFRRLILENPELDSEMALSLSHLPKGETRIFECRAEYATHSNEFKYLRGATVLVPAHTSDCSHHQLSSMAEAQDPMGDFIESDFAGVQANNWYWRRI